MKEFAQEKIIRFPLLLTTALSLLIGLIVALSRDKDSSFVSPFLNAKMTNYFKQIGIVTEDRFLPVESDTLLKLINWVEQEDFSKPNTTIHIRIDYKTLEGDSAYMTITKIDNQQNLQILDFRMDLNTSIVSSVNKTLQDVKDLYKRDIYSLDLYNNLFLGKAKIPEFLKEQVLEFKYAEETTFWLWTSLSLKNGPQAIQKKLLKSGEIFQELRFDTGGGDIKGLSIPNLLERVYPEEFKEFMKSFEKPGEQ